MTLRSYTRPRLVVLAPQASVLEAARDRNVSVGQIEDVRSQLPEEMRSVFPG
jgi:uncharacterized protein (DUF2267 family)